MSQYFKNSTSSSPSFTAQQYVYASAQTGSDTTGNGSAINPYATVTHTLGTISDNSAAKPYTIIATGVFAESIALKPWVNIQGYGYYATSFTGATLDASFSTPSGPTINLTGIFFSSMSLVLANTGGDTATFVLSNCLVSGTTVFTSRGASDNFTLTDTIHISATTITDGGIESNSCEIGAINVSSLNDIFFWTSFGDKITSIVQTDAGQGNDIQILGSFIASSVTSSNNSSLSYDATSFPQGGIHLSAGATATQFTCCPGTIPITSVTAASYSVVGPDFYLACNRAGAIALTFPPASGSGRVITIKDISGAAGANHITATSAGSTFDGTGTLTISTNYGVQRCTDVAGSIWSLG